MGREFTEIKCCVYGLNINRDSVIKMMMFSFGSGDGGRRGVVAGPKKKSPT